MPLASLQDILAATEPASALAIGTQAAAALNALRSTQPQITLHTLPHDTATAELSSLGVHDLALVSDLARSTHARGGILLAQLRDLYARRVLVLLAPADAEIWSHQDMIGHGFSRVSEWKRQDPQSELYRFDIADYKTTPDWLNSRYWAHPELFDKHRW